MKQPRISVVIPCYNAEKYLPDTLQSALAQTYPSAEILVIDDGSTDRSREIARSYGPHVICLEQEHEGPSAARNRGTDHATGDWIAFLDADDIWRPEKLARQVDVLSRDPSVGLIYTGLDILEQDGTRLPWPAHEPRFAIEELKLRCLIVPSTVMARTHVLRQERWSTQFGSSEDWELFYRLSKRCKFAAVDESLVDYRQHPDSLTSRRWAEVLANARRVAQAIQRDLSGYERLIVRSKVDARLFASAAIAARAHGSSEYLKYMVRSLLAWPFPGVGIARHRALLKMTAQWIRAAVDRRRGP